MLDAHEAPTLHYYVMPYVPGESLRELLLSAGPLPLPRVLHIAAAVAGALDYAHAEQVLHRDIKPANILLDGERVMVCDFGVARAVEVAAGDSISSSGLVLGTPAYMSPEQAVGSESTRAATFTRWAACSTSCSLGEPVFTGATSQAVVAQVVSQQPRSLTSVRPDVPLAVEAALRLALARSLSGDRPARGS